MHPFTDIAADSVSSLGEAKLISSIRRWLGKTSPKAPFGIGDDCAVVPAGRSAQLLTVDPVIYGEHFNDAVPPEFAGQKLFKRNLSDIAAMGGKPRAAVVALALDSRVKTKWLHGFYKGLASIGKQYSVPIVGGDIARHQGGIIATLTLVGEAAAPRIITRSGAKQGDWICVTGCLGGSLNSGHHYKFKPRLLEGQWLAKHRYVRAMMDISDGLAKDILSVTPKGSRAALDPEKLPLRKGCDIRAALCDGEDYELLVVFSRDTNIQDLTTAWKRRFSKTPLTCIGHFESAKHPSNSCVDLSIYHGYEHLRKA